MARVVPLKVKRDRDFRWEVRPGPTGPTVRLRIDSDEWLLSLETAVEFAKALQLAIVGVGLRAAAQTWVKKTVGRQLTRR